MKSYKPGILVLCLMVLATQSIANVDISPLFERMLWILSGWLAFMMLLDPLWAIHSALNQIIQANIQQNLTPKIPTDTRGDSSP